MRIRRYTIVRLATAALLGLAGAFKLSAGAGAIATGGVVHGALTSTLLGAAETALAAALASGVWSAAVWSVTLTFFASFWAVAATKAVAGSATCGCFGALPTPPVAALFIDALAVLALINILPPDSSNWAIFRILRERRATLLAAEMAFAAASFGCGVISVASTRDAAADLGNPEQWIGRRLPMLSAIDIAPRLERGKWLVLFYRNDCSKCARLLRTYLDIIDGIARVDHRPTFAFIEIPPFSADDDACAGRRGCASGRADAARLRTLETPIELLVIDGIVRAATQR